MTYVFSFIKRFLSPSSFWLLLLISLVTNVLYFYLAQHNYNPGFSLSKIYAVYGDGNDYVQMAEGFYQTGSWKLNGEFTDFRLPGYLFIYLPFRLFLSVHGTLTAIIIFQSFFSAVAKVFLAKLAWDLFKSYPVFLFTFALVNLTDVLTIYNSSFFTESVASSLCVLCIYAMYKYRESDKNIFLLGAGLLFLPLFMLRPFMGLILALTYIFLLIKYKPDYKKVVKAVLLFSLPFILFEIGWVARNYQRFHKLQPMETSITQGRKTGVNPHSKSIELVTDFGGNSVFWDDNAQGTWFYNVKKHFGPNRENPSDNILPSVLFTNGLTIDKLKEGRAFHWKSEGDSLSADSANYYAQQAVGIYQQFIDNLRANHPYTFYVHSRVKSMYFLLYQPKSYFNGIKYPLNIAFVFTNAAVNVFIFIFGFICLFFLAYKWKDRFNLYVTGIPLLLLFFMAFFIKSSEPRSALLAFPFLCISASWGANYLLYNKNRWFKLILLAVIITAMLIAFKHTTHVIKF